MSRIHAFMNPVQMANVMCEGNPGALNVIMKLMDPENFHLLLMCDTLELYGTRLYMFAHDCCGDSVETMWNVIREFQAGRISKEEIAAHVDDPSGYGKPFEIKK